MFQLRRMPGRQHGVSLQHVCQVRHDLEVPPHGRRRRGLGGGQGPGQLANRAVPIKSTEAGS